MCPAVPITGVPRLAPQHREQPQGQWGAGLHPPFVEGGRGGGGPKKGPGGAPGWRGKLPVLAQTGRLAGAGIFHDTILTPPLRQGPAPACGQQRLGGDRQRLHPQTLLMGTPKGRRAGGVPPHYPQEQGWGGSESICG